MTSTESSSSVRTDSSVRRLLHFGSSGRTRRRRRRRRRIAQEDTSRSAFLQEQSEGRGTEVAADLLLRPRAAEKAKAKAEAAESVVPSAE